MIDWKARARDLLSRTALAAHRERCRARKVLRPVEFGFFGKHPGWKDYLDGHLPLEGSCIARFKQVIERSIRRQLLERQGDRLPFDHLICWRQRRQMLVARIWESHDQQDSRRFPMTACVAFHGWKPAQALAFAWPLLERFRCDCLVQTDSKEIRKRCDSAIRAARAKACRFGPKGYTPFGPAIAVADEQPKAAGRASDHIRTWLRILSLRARVHPIAVRFQSIPAIGRRLRALRQSDTATDGIAEWLAAVRRFAGFGAAALLVAPLNATWIDITTVASIGQWDHAVDRMTLDCSPAAATACTEVFYTGGRIIGARVLRYLCSPDSIVPVRRESSAAQLSTLVDDEAVELDPAGE